MLREDFDPRPLRVRVIEFLENNRGRWFRARDVAAALGDPNYSVSAILSKHRMYGSKLELQNKHWRMP